MFVGNFFASLFLVGRHHEWTVRERTVADVKFVLAEIILWILIQVHVAINSVVMGRSRISGMITMELLVKITNDHDGQSVSVFSSFVVRSIFGFQFKRKWNKVPSAIPTTFGNPVFFFTFLKSFFRSSLSGHVW